MQYHVDSALNQGRSSVLVDWIAPTLDSGFVSPRTLKLVWAQIVKLILQRFKCNFLFAFHDVISPYVNYNHIFSSGINASLF